MTLLTPALTREGELWGGDPGRDGTYSGLELDKGACM